jgi:hypothetical protein
VASKILLVYEEYSEMMVAQNTLLKVGYDVLGISTEYTVGENVLSFNPDVVVGSGRNGKVTTLGVGRRMREMTRWQGKCILIFPAGYKPNPQDFAKIRGDILLEAPIPAVRLLQVIAQLVGDDEVMLLDRLGKQSMEAPDQSPIIVESLAPAPKPSLEPASSPATPTPAAAKVPDLESLWNELTESTVAPSPEVPKAPVTFDLKERQGELSEFELHALSEELLQVKKTERERVARYTKLTAKMEKPSSPQGLSKLESRKVQKELVKSWNPEEIAKLDELRREFTKALFKKK